MADPSGTAAARSDFESKLRAMNDALLISSVRQHELTEKAEKAEAARRESEEWFRAIADYIPQLAWMADGEGYVGWFNRGWLEYTGTTLEQNQGVGWKAVHHPDYLERVAEKFERHLREGKDWEDTFPLRGRDGEYRWFLSRMNAIRDESGRLVRFFGTNTDVTAQFEMENTIRRQAESLADLHRRKDEFLAMLSHELRNPLAPILNAVHLLRLRDDGDQLQLQARTIIERQVGQLKHLIDDLLEISRITTGRIHLNQERVAVGGIVDHAVETARPLIGQRRHALTVSVPPEPIWLYADASRLEQVVVNLLANAAKYTDEGGHIWLDVRREGDDAVLRVRDTGVGIAPELLPRIFDLFTQAKRSLDRSQGGLGIGLALVQRLVEMHRGRVEAHSTLGRGSEFVVRLPVVPSPVLPPPPAAATAEPTASLRVLVVDDNVDTAESMAELLRVSGHDVRTAHDGPTGLAAALDFRPNVVLLDIGLPGLSGFVVAERIRQQPAPAGVVLVAMTGYGQESDRQRSREAGFDHHLVKPADFGEVQHILAAVSGKAT